MNIIFICTGNTCRSPMAEYIAKRESYKAGMECTVVSAGLAANPNDKANKNAIEVMSEIGIDISGHTAKQLTAELANNADYIIPMTSSQKAALINAGIDQSKILELDEQINDPFGQSIEVYRACRDQLLILIRKLLVRLIER